jgi:transposase
VPMSYNRFNHNVDRRVKTKAAPLQRVEVITGVELRREWTDEEKLAIIAESCQAGAVISDVARRHGLRPRQLFTWRNGFRKRDAARCARR